MSKRAAVFRVRGCLESCGSGHWRQLFVASINTLIWGLPCDQANSPIWNFSCSFSLWAGSCRVTLPISHQDSWVSLWKDASVPTHPGPPCPFPLPGWWHHPFAPCPPLPIHLQNDLAKARGVTEWVRVAQSCPTLCDAMDWLARLLCPWNSPGQITGVVAFPFSRGLPNPGIELRSPTLQADSLPSEPPGKPNQEESKNQTLHSFPLIKG